MNAIRVENIVIFPEKREFLITRGGRHVVVHINNQGRVMVRLQGYENYYYDVRTGGIYSQNAGGAKVFLKPTFKSKRAYYWLSIAGFEKMVGLDTILRDNLKGIELYFAESRNVLKNFQDKGRDSSH